MTTGRRVERGPRPTERSQGTRGPSPVLAGRPAIPLPPPFLRMPAGALGNAIRGALLPARRACRAGVRGRRRGGRRVWRGPAAAVPPGVRGEPPPLARAGAGQVLDGLPDEQLGAPAARHGGRRPSRVRRWGWARRGRRPAAGPPRRRREVRPRGVRGGVGALERRAPRAHCWAGTAGRAPLWQGPRRRIAQPRARPLPSECGLPLMSPHDAGAVRCSLRPAPRPPRNLAGSTRRNRSLPGLPLRSRLTRPASRSGGKARPSRRALTALTRR